MSAGFVGRRVELALLDSVCSKANADSRPAAALISGVPGSGKSRLLAELPSRRRATHVLGVVGYESAFQVPLGAAANLLRGLGKVSDAGETLREFLFSPNPVDDRSLEPLRLFEAARRALLGLEGSILLVADDLQWVDDLSLALCSYLVRSAAEEEIPFAVIAATRPTSRGLAFHDSLLKDLGEDRVRTIDLGPLEPDEGVQLIRQLGPQLSAQRVAELWTQSNGSPFWLAFLARSGEEHDLADYIATTQRGLRRDAARMLALLWVATRPLAALTRLSWRCVFCSRRGEDFWGVRDCQSSRAWRMRADWLSRWRSRFDWRSPSWPPRWASRRLPWTGGPILRLASLIRRSAPPLFLPRRVPRPASWNERKRRFHCLSSP